MSKIILVKGGHGLENVRLNLFSVTISSVRTIGLPAPFFMSHKASFAKHTNTICKACTKILRHYCKVWEALSKIDFDIQKII
jgi:hypothetical protein